MKSVFMLSVVGCGHRRYAEPLLDILIAGGQLAPGGKIESTVRASVCVFRCEPMVESLKEHVQVSFFPVIT